MFPRSPRLRQTNINLRLLYTAYSKEECVQEIAFLRDTAEDVTNMPPRALEEAACSLSKLSVPCRHATVPKMQCFP